MTLEPLQFFDWKNHPSLRFIRSFLADIIQKSVQNRLFQGGPFGPLSYKTSSQSLLFLKCAYLVQICITIKEKPVQFFFKLAYLFSISPIKMIPLGWGFVVLILGQELNKLSLND